MEDYLNNKENRKNKIIGIVTTIIVHGLVLLCFCFLGLTHQVPLPPEYGIEVDMGGGGGGAPENTQKISARVSSSNANEKLITQEQEETIAMSSQKTSARQTVTRQPKTTTTTEQTPKEPEPTVNPNALFKRNANAGTGQGTGSGSGKGSGTGTGQGSEYGSGIGNYGGDFYLNGRPVITKAFPSAKNNLEGVVKVEFRADRDGNVIYAKAGIRGTTINDPQIGEECEKAAYRSKFKAKADADREERGVITYRFVLQ